MRYLSHESRPQNRVTAVFDASAISFEVSEAVTLAELAGRLAYLGERHQQVLIGVDLLKGHDPQRVIAVESTKKVRPGIHAQG